MADALQISMKLMERHAKRIGVQDGVNKSALREWLEDISSAKEWTAASDVIVLANVGCLVKGNLDTSIRNWIRDYDIEGVNVTWALIRGKIEGEFLDADEREHLRKNLEAMRQKAGQDVKEFSREFQKAVKLAYSNEEMGVPVVLEQVIRLFVASLRQESVRMLVYMGRPATLVDAYKAGQSADRAMSYAKADARVEEPMEIGAAKVSDRAEDSQDIELGAFGKVVDRKPTEVNKLLETIKMLETKVSTLEKKNSQQSGHKYWPHRRGRGDGPKQMRNGGRPQWTADDRPICWGCGQAGHLRHNCGKQGN